MSWFGKTYETDAGLTAICNNCGLSFNAYTSKTLRKRKRKHKPGCRRNREDE